MPLFTQLILIFLTIDSHNVLEFMEMLKTGFYLTLKTVKVKSVLPGIRRHLNMP